MTPEEFRPLLLRVATIEAKYDDWLSDESEKLAASSGVKPAEVYRSMVGEYLLAVGPYSPEEISAVLNQIAAGRRPLPTYSALWRQIASYAADNRSATAERERIAYDSQRRYECLACRDNGHVAVFDPAFVEAFRRRPEGATYSETIRNWRFRTQHPGLVAALCYCGCRRRNIQREQREKWRNGDRSRPPACGDQVTYDPAKHLLAGAEVDAEERLIEWCASHDGSEQNEWRPEPGGYERAIASSEAWNEER